jgi:hypothetical protein
MRIACIDVVGHVLCPTYPASLAGWCTSCGRCAMSTLPGSSSTRIIRPELYLAVVIVHRSYTDRPVVRLHANQIDRRRRGSWQPVQPRIRVGLSEATNISTGSQRALIEGEIARAVRVIAVVTLTIIHVPPSTIHRSFYPTQTGSIWTRCCHRSLALPACTRVTGRAAKFVKNRCHHGIRDLSDRVRINCQHMPFTVSVDVTQETQL